MPTEVFFADKGFGKKEVVVRVTLTNEFEYPIATCSNCGEELFIVGGKEIKNAVNKTAKGKPIKTKCPNCKVKVKWVVKDWRAYSDPNRIDHTGFTKH